MKLFVYEYATATVTNESSSLFIEGRAMRDALLADVSRIEGVSVMTFDARLGFDGCLSRCDTAWLVAPEFDGILYDLAMRVEQAGKRLIGPTSNAIRLTSDKLGLSQRWEEHDVPTPRTVRVDATWRDEFKFPVVVKPIDGAGSTVTRLVRSDVEFGDAVQAASAAGFTTDRMIVQPYQAGTPCSVAFLHGQPLRPMTQQIDSGNGFAYSGGETIVSNTHSHTLTQIAKRAADCVPGLHGYVGIDLILGEGDSTTVALEINPRLTTSYVGLRRATRENLAERVLFPERIGKPINWKASERLRFQTNGAVQTWNNETAMWEPLTL